MKLQKASPLYIQLKELLAEYIRREQPTMLPAESELMTQYGVSRKTVRTAIAELVKSGLVTPLPGKGTLVNQTSRGQGSELVILLDDFAVLPPYLYEIYTAVKNGLDAAGRNPAVILVNPSDADLPVQLESLTRRAETVLMFSAAANREDLYQILKKQKVLSVGYRPRQAFHAVYSDLFTGFSKVVRHLLGQGHRRIAAAALARDAERHRAFDTVLNEAGIDPAMALWIDAAGTRLDGYRAAEMLAEKKVTGVVAHNDLCALGIMEYALQHRIAVPAKISIAGCDNVADARHFPIPLTTAGHDLDAYRRTIVDFLAAQAPRRRMQMELDMPLIVRESVKKITGD